MATGISKNRYNLNSVEVSTIPTEADNAVRLTYAGKRDEQTILHEAHPVQLETVWPDTTLTGNRLYYHDNLPVLASLLADPTVRGQVRLVYIDPPYATGSIFQSRSQDNAYPDLLVGARYVEFLRERLIFLRELLATDGSIYIHLDKNMAFTIKLVMDEIFGPQNFRNWIVRKKCNPKNYTHRVYGNVADYILFYTKSDNYVWQRSVENWTPERAAREYPCVDEAGRRYKKVPVHAPGVRNGTTGQIWRGMLPPPGKHWQYTPTRLDEMDARGEIYWSPNGNPRRKVYFENSEGVPVQDIWLEFLDPYNQNSKITGYPTEKNPALLSRIIEASSNPGDLVLDCFSGSGTTMAVADQLARRWIGIDNSGQAIAATLKRFEDGTKPMGDFVTARSNANDSHQLTFALEEDGMKPSNVDQYTKIKDFTLWSDPSFKRKLTELKVQSSLDIAEILGQNFESGQS